MKSPLRTAYENEVLSLRPDITQSELDAMSNDALIDIINKDAGRTEEQLKRELKRALNEFENCLTLAGLEEIRKKYSQLHNNNAFNKAYGICQDNITNLKA